MKERSTDPAPFDVYAGDYDAALAEGLSLSGEDKYYFARGRINFLRQRLIPLNHTVRSVLDFGCGTGTSAPLLLEIPGVESVLGVDLSAKSIEIARQSYGTDRVRFEVLNQITLADNFDLAFCNGVFHHIPLSQRAGALQSIARALRPGGLFAFWENNPWNPGTRYVMSRIPFDRDAITLAPPEAARLLRDNGFAVLRADFLFIFPKVLRWFRVIEPFLSRLPFGAQYQVLCQKQ
jgi:SAM-dependent methyltransferase